jgi:hypothetical protein
MQSCSKPAAKRIQSQRHLVFPVTLQTPWAIRGEGARCISLADGLKEAKDDLSIVRIHEFLNFST